MRISDWSSYVCSSDLQHVHALAVDRHEGVLVIGLKDFTKVHLRHHAPPGVGLLQRLFDSEEHARFRLVQDTAFPETGAQHVIELDGGISHRRHIRPKREELSAPFIRPPLLPAAPAIIAPRGTAIEDDAAQARKSNTSELQSLMRFSYAVIC